MKKLKLKSLAMMMMIALPTYAADNEIFITQSGTTANIDLEQLGSSNIIGGLNATAGSMTTLDLDGNAFTLDINQIGNTNKFLGDIWGDNVTAFLNLMAIATPLQSRQILLIPMELITLI